MNDLQVAGAGMALVAAALAVVVRLLHRPLASTMAELCGERRRGEFWTYMSEIALAVGSLLVVLIGVLLTPVFSARTQPLLAVATLLRWGLAGLLLALATVAALVVRFTVRLGTHIPPAYGTGSVPSDREDT
jgi:hypothetical protein